MFSFLLFAHLALAGQPIDPARPISQQSKTERLIKRPLRNRLIERSELNKETLAMDELDKDLLVLRAQHQPLPSLKKFYPNLPVAKLKTLQALAGEQQ